MEVGIGVTNGIGDVDPSGPAAGTQAAATTIVTASSSLIALILDKHEGPAFLPALRFVPPESGDGYPGWG